MTATVDSGQDLNTEPLRSRRNHWNNQIRRHAMMQPDAPALKFLGATTTWKQLDDRCDAEYDLSIFAHAGREHAPEPLATTAARRA